MKYLLIVILSLLLVACTDEEVLYSNTPDKAIELLESEVGFVKNMNVILIQETDINVNRKIYVFEGEGAISDNSENKTQYFVALVEKQKKGWVVLESLGIGKPSDRSIATGGNYIEAGFIDISENLELKKTQYALNIPEKDYSIWVELLE
ncbi:hypothetical protein [Sporosarcina sp. Marseille-Q4943]|uniref:hypothetical protein n=1 Tax=Sporosarcina sp. Marseille-Q4943 TaxID=2942204 RepID=UPI00208DA927|nr:hypothetical protein [Sporosarcina sp. Marseille-Q4943]